MLVSLLGIIFPAYAVKNGEQVTEVLSVITSNTNQSPTVSSEDNILSSPNSSVTLSFSESIAESWDAKNKPKNLIANCINGTSITGFEYSNVTIQTVGTSFISEAMVYFSNSNNGDDGVVLAIGGINQNSGTATFSSSGIIDITDNDFPDVLSLSDSKFNIQFYETIDDSPDAIDARFLNGTIKVYGVDLIATNNCPFIAGETNTDLSVQYNIDQAENYTVGSSIDLTIEVANIGSIAATNVVLNNSLSAKLRLDDFSCDDGTSTTDTADLLALSVQDIPANSTLQCILTTTVLSAGEIENSVTVSADNDNNTSNNNASLSIFGTTAVAMVPVNNKLVLLLLVLSLLFFSRKRFS